MRLGDRAVAVDVRPVAEDERLPGVTYLTLDVRLLVTGRIGKASYWVRKLVPRLYERLMVRRCDE